jgi:hypothetical protein
MYFPAQQALQGHHGAKASLSGYFEQYLQSTRSIRSVGRHSEAKGMQFGHMQAVTQQDGLHQWSRWDVAAAAVGCSGGVPALSEVLADE